MPIQSNQLTSYEGSASGKNIPTGEKHYLQGVTIVPDNTTTSDAYNVGTGIGDALTSTAKGIQDAYSGYVDAQIAAANMANSASAEAQAAQFNYNKQLMNLQNIKQEEYLKRMMDFNTTSAKQANEFTEKMWQKAADYNTNIFNLQNSFNKAMWEKTAKYNTQEAENNRAWQQEMSNTAYQRAVNDMRAAGINPILAAQNGGAHVGSGATASIGSVSSGSSSMGSSSGAQAAGVSSNAAGGSVGNFTGQGYHLSDTMAIMGSVMGVLGEALTGLQANGFFGQAAEAVKSAMDDVDDAIYEMWTDFEDGYDKTMDKMDEFATEWFGYHGHKEGHSGSGGGHDF